LSLPVIGGAGAKWYRISKGSRVLNGVKTEFIVTLITRKITPKSDEQSAELCENLCEKNFPKYAKIGKNRKKRGKSYIKISIFYNNLRRLRNSEVLTTNP
jgi:hypothetical protein